jgi:hypothetical protein
MIRGCLRGSGRFRGIERLGEGSWLVKLQRGSMKLTASHSPMLGALTDFELFLGHLTFNFC